MSALEAGKKGRAYERPEKPVRPRDAASLVICRQRKGVTEVLMGRRASRHRFMPNIFVFPGGRVDTADRQAKIAADLAKPVARKLQNKWSPQMARALAVAAVRETFEETGLVIGERQKDGVLPNLAALDYVARAITPPDSPMRFHARFFTIDVNEASGRVRDSDELQNLQWFSLDDALAMDVVDVTEFVLGEVKRRHEGWRPPGVPLFSYRNGRAVIKYEA
ncbi:MAG: NUDIX hydrolase [Rhodospirillaceae bacterium]|jgi:8-oxo-dGTP pyrophosphatase MutT (NUDIX family)|nr:NUDIX hydrolase [Rhodospirillaceae bacterium]MBT4491223.1 NUDIX hydrolase [Rhodospirillaceae bacterium]MBT5195512.1 NUDIX hydrolase [Rhodospirillaceae bacterium]MBT5894786.1 NUDIX hydrolase [Rhodospirillaceae bacterium]MBT7760463.1 NUDIX hydrolase [Rhodospirillaceae bacterium]